jgi:hypothetical protein
MKKSLCLFVVFMLLVVVNAFAVDRVVQGIDNKDVFLNKPLMVIPAGISMKGYFHESENIPDSDKPENWPVINSIDVIEYFIKYKPNYNISWKEINKNSGILIIVKPDLFDNRDDISYKFLIETYEINDKFNIINRININRIEISESNVRITIYNIMCIIKRDKENMKVKQVQQ